MRERDTFFADRKKGTAFAVPFDGRGDRIRTCGLFVPNEALYQAEPHLDFDMSFIDSFFIISACKAFVNGIFEKIENFAKGYIQYPDVHRDTVGTGVAERAEAAQSAQYDGTKRKGVGLLETWNIMCSARGFSQWVRKIGTASRRNCARAL